MSEVFSFQVHPTYRAPIRPEIDRANSRMFGVVAAMDVEATGHGMCFDVKSLEQVAELGNARETGVPGRFGHPGMSENAVGRNMHMAHNWRVVAGVKADDPHHYLLHDSQFLPAARVSPAFTHDPVEYIMRMAETHPDQFGESMVIRGRTVWTTERGKELPTREVVEDKETGEKELRHNSRPDDALTEVPVLRPTELHFVDWVNEGAVTHSGIYPLSALGGEGGRGGYTRREYPHVALRGDRGEYTRREYPPVALRGGRGEYTRREYPHVALRGGRGGYLRGASIFAEGNASNLFLAQLFTQIDEMRQRFGVPLDALDAKVARLLDIYVNSRENGEDWAGEGDGVDVRNIPPLFFEGQIDRNESIESGEDRIMTRRTRQDRRTARKTELSDQALDPVAVAAELENMAEETDDTLDRSTQILRQAEQLAASMTQSGAAMQNAPSLASSAQIDHLQQQIDQNTDQVHELTLQLKKLSELLVRNMELTAILQRNISRVNGDAVVTQRVPLTGANGQMEGFLLQQPMPGGDWAALSPLSTEERLARLPAGMDEDSPEARVMRSQARRAQLKR